MKLNPTFAKLAILALVTLLLCYVLAEIGGLARERQARQLDAAENVEQSFAGPQSLSGPMLTRWCRETWTVAGPDKKTTTETRYFWLFAAPRTLTVKGGISPEVRHRGLFKVNTYASQLTMEPISSGAPRRLTGMVATIFSSTSGLIARTMSVPM